MSAQRTRRTGPRALDASAEARRRATVILETLTGVRTTQEAAEALGVAPARYYQLETYALQGLVEALEPRPRGRRVDAQVELDRHKGEIARLTRDVARQQALYRTAQRALGVPPVNGAVPKGKADASTTMSTSTSKSAKKKVRRRRRTSRGERVAAALATASAPASESPSATATKESAKP